MANHVRSGLHLRNGSSHPDSDRKTHMLEVFAPAHCGRADESPKPSSLIPLSFNNTTLISASDHNLSSSTLDPSLDATSQ
eukprot:103239-Rhodomonas_salina.2